MSVRSRTGSTSGGLPVRDGPPPAAADLFAADVFTATVPAASATGADERPAARWDGHRRRDRVDRADLVPAATRVAVARPLRRR